MPDRRWARRALAALALGVASLGVLLPSAASAHSLDSTTVSVHVAEDRVDATLTLPLQTLAEALGTDEVDTGDALAYVTDHLTVTGADGATWADTVTDSATRTVDGIESLVVDVAFDSGSADTSSFVVSYDGILEAVPGHEAVVVLTDAAGDVSTPGVIDAVGESVTIGDATATSTGLVDMVGFGLHHVLAGADHLLFLVVLLLPAPLLVASGRWQGRRPLRSTLHQVLHVVTAFTLGHSLTLIAAGLGLVDVPTRAVEVLIAISVGVGAMHAMRPLVRRGEVLIAGAFGLVHGLAFAAILGELGARGADGVLPLLAFNLGVELAQLLVVLLVFPSILLLSRTRFLRPARLVGASLALAAAVAWALDRLGVVGDPLADAEQSLVDHPWWVVAAAAALAVVLAAVDVRAVVVSPARVRVADEG